MVFITTMRRLTLEQIVEQIVVVVGKIMTILISFAFVLQYMNECRQWKYL